LLRTRWWMIKIAIKKVVSLSGQNRRVLCGYRVPRYFSPDSFCICPSSCSSCTMSSSQYNYRPLVLLAKLGRKRCPLKKIMPELVGRTSLSQWSPSTLSPPTYIYLFLGSCLSSSQDAYKLYILQAVGLIGRVIIKYLIYLGTYARNVDLDKILGSRGGKNW
jgi:hypothetical protein